MATAPVNSRDNLLQLLVPRVLGTTNNSIFLSITTQQFTYDAGGVAQPTYSLITANLVGNITGAITFTSTGIKTNSINGSAGTASTSSVIFEKPTSNSIKVYPADMSADIATISATVTYQGTTYTATPVTIQRTYAGIQATLTQPIKYYSTDSLGAGYTIMTLADQLLPSNVIKLELGNASTKFTSGVTYTPTASSPQILGGLKLWLTSAGELQLEEVSLGSWSQDSVSFTVTATRSGSSYTDTFTVTKNKAGNAPYQTGTISLYRWDVLNPSSNGHLPNAKSSYVWLTQTHTYTPIPVITGGVIINDDSWYTSPASKPTSNADWRLWKITLNIQQITTANISSTTSPQTLTNIDWTSNYKITEVTTTSNEFVKTGVATLYINNIPSSLPIVPVGQGGYIWSSNTVNTTGTTLNGWQATIPAPAVGQALYKFSVSLIANVTDTTTTVYWTKGIIELVTVYGVVGANAIGVDLVNSSHSIPCDYQDTATSRNFTNSGNKIFAYDGTTALTAIAYTSAAASTFSKGQYVVEVDTADGVTAGTQTLVTENGATGVSYANLTAAIFSITVTGSLLFKLRGKNYAGETFTYLVKQTFSKGPTGTPGTVSYLVANANIIVKSNTGIYTPSTITFSGRKNTNGLVTAEPFFFSIFLNGSSTATVSTTSTVIDYTYTIPPNTTIVEARIYSTNPATGSPVAIDTEGISVVSDGVQGTAGRVGDSARRAYTKSTLTPNSTPAVYNGSSGDALPPTGTWFSTSGVAGIGIWSTTPPTINEGEILYQSDGIYIPGGNTTWGFPYLSSLKVGNLQAITANTGDLYVSGSLRGGGGGIGATIDLNNGIGYYLDKSGNMRVGNPTSDYLKWDGTNLLINTIGKVTIGNSTGSRMVWDGVGLNIYDVNNKAIVSAGTVDWNVINNIPSSITTAGQTWVPDVNTQLISGIELARTTGGVTAWNNKAYTIESFVAGAFISFQAYQTNAEFQCGFSINPTNSYAANSSYVIIDYGIRCLANGTVQIWTGATNKSIPSTTYTTANVFSITYDNQYVNFYKDATLLLSIDTGAISALRFSAIIAFQTPGARAKNIRFGPSASRGSIGVSGSSTATITLYQKSATVPSVPVANAVSYTINTNTVTGSGSWLQTLPTVDNTPTYAITATIVTSTPGTAFPIPSWSTPVVMAQSGTAGAPGNSIRVLQLYQKSATAPSAPSGVGYIISTNSITGNGSWQLTMPAADSTPIYMISAIVSTSTPATSFSIPSWTTPVIVAQSGTSGANGNSIRVLELYQKGATVPAAPTLNAVEYTMSTNTATGTSGWSLTMPAVDATPVYMISATIVTATPSVGYKIPLWSTPVVVAQNGTAGKDGTNGTNGTDGANGNSIRVVQLFQKSATPPTIPAGNVAYYTISTNSITGNGSWSLTMPAVDATPVYMTSANVTTSTPSIAFQVPVWNAAIIVAQSGTAGKDGTNGTNGANGNTTRVVQLYQKSATAPSVPSGVGYIISTNSITGNGSWQLTMPAADTTPIYMISAIVSTSTPATSFSIPSWTTPVIVAQNGTSGANGNTIRVLQLFQKSATPPSSPGLNVVEYITSTNTATGTSGWSLTMPAVDATPVYMISATIVTATPSVGYKIPAWSTPIVVAQNGTAGKDGTNGTDGANGNTTRVVQLYQKSATTPSAPSGVGYIISTNSITGNGSWQLTMPAADTTPIYMISAIVSTSTPTTSFSISSWTAPVIVAQNGTAGKDGTNGTSGANGNSIRVVQLFQKSVTAPSVPVANVAKYNINTNSIIGNGSWSLTMPSVDATPVYMISATVITNTPSVDFSIPSWTAAVIVAQSGTSGTSGANGNTIRVVELYQKSTTLPPVPVNNAAYYTISTNTISGVSGWQLTMPSVDATPVYMTSATVTTSSPSSPFQVPSWTAAVIVAQSGTNGTDGKDGTNGTSGSPGNTIRVVQLYQKNLIKPSTPIGAKYTISTNSITGNGSWSLTMPAVDATPVYMTSVTIITTTPTVAFTITNSSWTDPVVVAQSGTSGTAGRDGTNGTAGKDGTNGTSGANGISISVVELYQKSATLLTSPPPNSITYNVSSNSISGNGSWSLTMPAVDATPVYMVRATIITSTPATDYTVPLWTAPIVVAQNGTNGTSGKNGTDGSPGVSNVTVQLFIVSASTPTRPTSVSYNVSTATASNIGSWSQSMPNASTNPTWMISAVVSTSTPTVAISIPAWTSPVKVAVLGGGSTASGARGSVTVPLITTDTTWSDTAANNYFTTNYSGVKVLNDTMTQSDGSTWAITKFWNGSAWVTANTVIDGNQLIKGTLGADKLSANSVIADNISFTGKLNTKSATTGQRMEITNTYIKVFDANGIVRVQIGDLTA